jgi:ATP-dependent helicase Lhr and Lhr-like helicase
VSAFEKLHPALQHHIVNSLGWRELRPFQENVIPSVLAGNHLIILAPTAGGKTEAAFFPALSRIMTEDWQGLSVLYVCPIKALLNNLDQRLSYYCELLGRKSALWHGDVGTSARRKILREPPSCLLTTPESLEVMLVSRSVDEQRMFENLQMIIVDEVHAFAGDDRGWHLLSVLERVSKLAGREIQRIGLSATVGNPETLLEWLAGNCKGSKNVAYPPASVAAPADVQIDYVGSLENAATVISKLHRGEKRLVFLDSRAGTEDLGLMLRSLGVNTFVTHSSLSQEERHRTEKAFAEETDCVIVATSVLELGIDVGDLDRVIQIDAPLTVASFLQRMGRTGRRSGSTRNCLMLATKPERLLQAAALTELWESGFVEPIVPPPEPYHILSQQLMALALQESGIGRNEWFKWIEGVYAFSRLPSESVKELVQWMIETEILSDDAGLLWLGRKGEQSYGRQNFIELFSVFMTPPIFRVLHGKQEIGQVDESALLAKQDGPRVLSLGGNAWKVNYIDWQRKIAYVEPTDVLGRTRWPGSGLGLSYKICKTMQAILCRSDQSDRWSKRCKAEIERLRDDFSWLQAGSTSLLLESGDRWSWWTFAGAKANATLAYYLAQDIKSTVSSDGFSLKFSEGVTSDQVQAAQQVLMQASPADLRPIAHEKAIRGLKFSECLSPRLADQVTSMRLRDDAAVASVLHEQVRVTIPSPDETFKPSIGSRRSSHATPNKPDSPNSIRVGDTEIELGDADTADKSVRALSVRQPWAELIMLGNKEIEYRNYPTDVRGIVYIYASATRYPAEDERDMQSEYGLDLDSLPRGVIVGTVEVYDCLQGAEGGYEWLFRSPTRLTKPLRPKRKPEPSWFFPF